VNYHKRLFGELVGNTDKQLRKTSYNFYAEQLLLLQKIQKFCQELLTLQCLYIKLASVPSLIL